MSESDPADPADEADAATDDDPTAVDEPGEADTDKSGGADQATDTDESGGADQATATDETDDGASTAIEARTSTEVVQAMADRLPNTRLQAAAPTKTARGLAFGSILVGGVCGGLIGFAFTDLQCDDGCTVWAGLSGIVGAIVGAIGVAIVAVLVLRAMDEWETVQNAQPGDHPSRKRPS